MTVEEVSEKVWDRSYMSLDEIQNDLQELYNEGWVEGYTAAESKMKAAAKKLIQEGC